jgi:hypothetical protein
LIGIFIDEMVTVVTYKSKTVEKVLTEIAGLLVLGRVLTLFLRSFNEWKYNKKIMKENNEDFREVFTYANFKKTMKEYHEMREENREMNMRMIEMKTEIDQLKQSRQTEEESEKYTGQRIKND